MRARSGLAYALWGLAERGAAIEHARELLRLNPNDNQGIRYLLLEWLLTEGRDEEAGALLKRYENDAAAAWLYGHTLLGFRTEGRSARVENLLREALKENSWVPAYLLGEKELPQEEPEFTEWGGESEAVEYVQNCEGLWYYTPGALQWLKEARDRVGVTATVKRKQVCPGSVTTLDFSDSSGRPIQGWGAPEKVQAEGGHSEPDRLR